MIRDVRADVPVGPAPHRVIRRTDDPLLILVARFTRDQRKKIDQHKEKGEFRSLGAALRDMVDQFAA